MATVVEHANPTNQAALRVDAEGRLMVVVKGGGGGGGGSGLSEAQVKTLITTELAKLPAPYIGSNGRSRGNISMQGGTLGDLGGPNAGSDAATKDYVDGKIPVGLPETITRAKSTPRQVDVLVWDSGVSKDGIFNRWHENIAAPHRYATWSRSPQRDAQLVFNESGLYAVSFNFNSYEGIVQAIFSQGGQSVHIQGAVFMANVSSRLEALIRVASNTPVRVQLRTTVGIERVANAIIEKYVE